MNPLIGFALGHPEQAAMSHLQRVGLEIAQDKEQSILGGGQGTIRIGGIHAPGAPFAIQTPQAHMLLKGLFKRLDQVPKLAKGQTGQIQQVIRRVLDGFKSQSAHLFSCSWKRLQPLLYSFSQQIGIMFVIKWVQRLV